MPSGAAEGASSLATRGESSGCAEESFVHSRLLDGAPAVS